MTDSTTKNSGKETGKKTRKETQLGKADDSGLTQEEKVQKAREIGEKKWAEDHPDEGSANSDDDVMTGELLESDAGSTQDESSANSGDVASSTSVSTAPKFDLNIIDFDQFQDSVNALSERVMPLKVADAADKKGYEIVRAARIGVKNLRVKIDKTHKRLKANSLEYGRKVDAIAKLLKEKILPFEFHLETQETFYIEAVAKRKAEEAAIRERELNRRCDILMSYGVVPSSMVAIQEMTPEEFDARVARAKSEKEEADRVVREAENKAAAERIRIAEERIAEEKRVAEHRVKMDEEKRLMFIEQEKLKQEKAKQAAELERQRKEIAAEAERLRLEGERLKKLEEERLAREKAERDRIEAERVAAERAAAAEVERKLIEEQERLRKIEQDRLAAEAEAIAKFEREALELESARLAKELAADVVSAVASVFDAPEQPATATPVAGVDEVKAAGPMGGSEGREIVSLEKVAELVENTLAGPATESRSVSDSLRNVIGRLSPADESEESDDSGDMGDDSGDGSGDVDDEEISDQDMIDMVTGANPVPMSQLIAEFPEVERKHRSEIAKFADSIEELVVPSGIGQHDIMLILEKAATSIRVVALSPFKVKRTEIPF